MAVRNLAKENTLVSDQAVEAYLAVLGDYEEVIVVVGELEGLHDVVDHHLVVNQE